jgi:hypothetical protein
VGVGLFFLGRRDIIEVCGSSYVARRTDELVARRCVVAVAAVRV